MTAVAQKTVLTGCLAPIDKGGLEQLIANSKANPKVIKTLKCKTVAEGKFRHANYIRNLAPYIVDEQAVTIVALDSGEILSSHRIELAKGYWRNQRRDPG